MLITLAKGGLGLSVLLKISSEEMQRVIPSVKIRAKKDELQPEMSYKVKENRLFYLSIYWLLNLHITPVHFIRVLTLCPCRDPTTGWPASQLPSKQLNTVVVTLA